MNVPWGWLDAAFAASERLPMVDRLKGGVRRGLVIGALWGGIALLLVGALLGGLNRGPAGAVIGGLSGATAGLCIGAIAGALFGPRYFYHADAAVVTIRLDGSDGPFRPGDAVRGHVLVAAHRTLLIDGGTIHLVCRGVRTYDELNGSGPEPELHRDAIPYVVAPSGQIPSRTIGRDTAVRYPFEFTLPTDALPSHHGHVYAIDWAIVADLGSERMPHLTAQREILVMAPPPYVPVYAGGYRSMVSAEVCQLILSLPKVLHAPGEAIHAALRLIPKRSFAADEIRAVLLRVENVPVGDDHTVYVAALDPTSGMMRGERRAVGDGTTYVWLESELDLTDRTTIRASESLNYEFCLQVPKEWRPTLDGPDGQVMWKLGVVVARPNQDDVRIFHEVIVHTFSPALQEADASPGQPPTRVRRVTVDRWPPWRGAFDEPLFDGPRAKR